MVRVLRKALLATVVGGSLGRLHHDVRLGGAEAEQSNDHVRGSVAERNAAADDELGLVRVHVQQEAGRDSGARLYARGADALR